jgi:hypothetical protein
MAEVFTVLFPEMSFIVAELVLSADVSFSSKVEYPSDNQRYY